MTLFMCIFTVNCLLSLMNIYIYALLFFCVFLEKIEMDHAYYYDLECDDACFVQNCLFLCHFQ